MASACDPKMHQTKKGNQQSFGMKADIGVDIRSKVIHSVVAAAANVLDATVLPDLLHETTVWGDQVHRGQRAVIREYAPHCTGFHQPTLVAPWVADEAEKARNRTKSEVRVKVEHYFGVIKRMPGLGAGERDDAQGVGVGERVEREVRDHERKGIGERAGAPSPDREAAARAAAAFGARGQHEVTGGTSDGLRFRGFGAGGGRASRASAS